MSKVVNAAVEKLNEKIGSFGSTAKFVIEDEGAIMIDENGVRAGDDEAAQGHETCQREPGRGRHPVVDPGDRDDVEVGGGEPGRREPEGADRALLAALDDESRRDERDAASGKKSKK